MADGNRPESHSWRSSWIGLSFQITPAKAFFSLFVAALLLFLLGKYNSTIPASNLGINEWFPSSQDDDINIQTLSYKAVDVKLQQTRKDGIYDYCRAIHVSKPPVSTSVTLKYNAKFNLSYFGIPKIGSTFIKQMFNVLKYGPAYAKEKFSIPRNQVHKNFKGYDKRFSFNYTLEKTLTIVTVRNPYSRLFAAFIDKVFLSNNNKLVSSIVGYKHRHISENLTIHEQKIRNITNRLTVTFQDFLIYALDSGKKENVIFNHYGPCFPRLKQLICNSRHYIVVKQETFETDIIYILRSVGVDKAEHEAYNVIIKSLYESRVNDSIPGIIKVTFAKGYNKLIAGSIIAERLWQSFKIQGYISKHFSFPTNVFSSESIYSNVSFVVNAFLREMKKGKLSRTECMDQRHEAMLSAYKGLAKHVLRKVQHMYRSDFMAFGYNKILT